MKEALTKRVTNLRPKSPLLDEDLLSTGSTLLNLALSGRPNGGYMKGKYFFIVGDSKTGKTWQSLTCLAEAAINPEFDDYVFVFDDNEGGALMDMARFFGKEVLRRAQPPRRDKDGDPIFSESIEDFYDHIDDLVKRGQKFIYILDSMDGLTSQDEEKKFEEQKAARRKGTKTAGSYGDGKAKKNAQGLRRLKRGLRDTGSILIIISQTRDNINAGPFGEKKTRSGGRALRFYATAEWWSSHMGSIKKFVRGRTRKIGAHTVLKFQKNRLTGREDSVVISFYPSYGLDDVGSCVDFMVKEGFWTKEGKKGIKARDLKVTLDREKLIAYCEDRKERLVEAVTKAWKTLISETAITRKNRYA